MARPRKAVADAAVKDDELLTIGEVAARLKVSKPTVYRIIADGNLDRIDIGTGTQRSRTRIPASSLEKFLTSRHIKGRNAA